MKELLIQLDVLKTTRKGVYKLVGGASFSKNKRHILIEKNS